MATKSRKKSLRGVSDIRRFFYRNETPIYFIGATNFNLLGADEWVKGFKYITYIDCFDGQHPNVFKPSEMPHEVFNSIEEINNYLLAHPEVRDHINSRGPGGKALFLMFDEKTEALAEELGLQVCFPSAKIREQLDSKIETTRLADEAGVPSVPNVMAQVKTYKQLCKVAKHLGKELVIQTPYGDSGHTTFFISCKEDWDKYAEEIVDAPEVKVMKRIRCREAAIEACVTRHGAIVAPLMTELVGFPELTPYGGGWCGNEIFADAFTDSIRRKARKYTYAIGEALKKEGYLGYFELDFLIDDDTGELYLGEMNPRITGASSITNHAVFALSDAPLFLFHLLEWCGIDYDLSVRELNRRWARPENIDSWSQMIIKHTTDQIDTLAQAPPSGIYRMNPDETIEFARFDTHRRAVERDDEAFFLRITGIGDYVYEGADLGILVTRGRMMTDTFELTDRAQSWIKGIRSQFATTGQYSQPAVEPVSDIGDGQFKIM